MTKDHSSLISLEVNPDAAREAATMLERGDCAPRDQDSVQCVIGETCEEQIVVSELPFMVPLWEKISHILHTSDEVYNPNFSISRLAEMTGSNMKYVSMAINQNAGVSLPILLGNLRIKEACRRLLANEENANLSIDMIAFDVGIKSRSTFTTAFKRVTGMSAVEFIKQVKADRHKSRSILEDTSVDSLA